MNGWSRHLCNSHQAFAEAIFASRYIKCDAVFYWMPMYDEWHAYFKTRFRYLSLHEKTILTRSFLDTYDGFVLAIEKARDLIEREYFYYFNELWC